MSIREIAEQIARLTGFDGDLVWDPTRPDGQPRRRVDASRAERLFGWRATMPFEEGLRRTIDWYLAHRELADRRAARQAPGRQPCQARHQACQGLVEVGEQWAGR